MAFKLYRHFFLVNLTVVLLTCVALSPRFFHRLSTPAHVAFQDHTITVTRSATTDSQSAESILPLATSEASKNDKWHPRASGLMASPRSLAVRPFTAARPEVLLYTLTNGKLQASISSFGATVARLLVPDVSGGLADVVLGFDELQSYTDGTSPYFGSVVGRVANRIANATFSLNGKRYNLPANNGPNTLHGGTVGFDKVNWKSSEVAGAPGPSVRFTHTSPDGDQGFPGAVEVTVTYTLTSPWEMKTEMEARALTEPTPVSLAHHTYWNLGGHQSGTILEHHLKIYGSHYTPVDATQIPTGDIVAVKGTPFDFTEETKIGSRISDVPGGYDHNYVLDKDAPSEELPSGSKPVALHLAARVKEPSSGRVLELLTNVPGMQFYSGNFLDGSFKGKEGVAYEKHAAFCLETQGFPNAVNEPKFPSVILQPGEVYRHVMLHRFSTEA